MKPTKRSKITAIFTLALLVVLVSVVPASAQAQRLSFTGTTCTQSQTLPTKFWFSDDGILHSRGAILTNLDVTDGPYDTGINILTGNVDIDPATGYGHADGKFTIYPSAFEGTFEGSWSSHLSPDGIRGRAVGHGTGELEGVQIYNELSSDNPAGPCTNSNITILIP